MEWGIDAVAVGSGQSDSQLQFVPVRCAAVSLADGVE